MSDNSSDDRFSMPPLPGVWENRDDDEPAEEESEETVSRAAGLTLPPPGLFARLEEPASSTVTDDVEDEVDEEVEEELDAIDAAEVDAAEIEAADDEPVEEDEVVAAEALAVVRPPVAWLDEEDADADDPAPTALAGVADAVDIVEQLVARAEEQARGPSGDDLVLADAAEALKTPDPEPVPLPSYAAVDTIDDEPPVEEQDEVVEDATPAPISLPRYGDGDRADEEEILPHFLLEESAPLDIVAAQDQLREMAHKGRAKAVDEETKPSLARTLAEIPVLLIVAAVIAFLVKTFLAQAYYIPSGSMEPQLHIDDRVVVSKLAYKFHDPRRGDIIVFDDPHTGDATATASNDTGVSKLLRKVGEGVGVVQPSTDEFIKRVIGLPGDTVSGHDGYVYINDHKLIEPYLPLGLETSDFAAQTVAKGKLWVMGDNRGGSADSRVFGQIDIDSIVGRAVVKVWPFSHISFL